MYKRTTMCKVMSLNQNLVYIILFQVFFKIINGVLESKVKTFILRSLRIWQAIPDLAFQIQSSLLFFRL